MNNKTKVPVNIGSKTLEFIEQLELVNDTINKIQLTYSIVFKNDTKTKSDFDRIMEVLHKKQIELYDEPL